MHWKAPPPSCPRMDAFEAATEPGNHHGSHSHRERSAGHRGRSSHNHQSHHHPPPLHLNPTPFCQPITTVTASASVTVAVHQGPLSGLDPVSPHLGHAATDSYSSTGPEQPEPAFQDPHVPLYTYTGARGVQEEAVELQDLEFEAAENNIGRQASWGEISASLSTGCPLFLFKANTWLCHLCSVYSSGRQKHYGQRQTTLC